MALLLGYISALRYWQACSQEDDPKAFARLLGSREVRIKSTEYLKENMGTTCSAAQKTWVKNLDQDLSLIVMHKHGMRYTPKIKRHIYSTLPEESCVPASSVYLERALGYAGEVPNDIYVSTPEFCFLQFASVLQIEMLIMLGFELCGSYGSAWRKGALYNIRQLSSAKNLSLFLLSATGIRGGRDALKACKHVIDGSASPMETSLAMFLCLPYRLGGYGLPQPRMNCRIDVPSMLKPKLKRGYCLCDLYWDEERLAIEYDSDLYHAGIDKTVDDALRRTVLTSLDVSVMSVTRPQIVNPQALRVVANSIGNKVGKRIKVPEPQFSHRHYNLRSYLFNRSRRF